jgi:hypothetical protein
MRILPVLAGVAGLSVLLTTGSLLAHDPITTKVSWDREIAPIVQARCVSCHAPGGSAMSLATYKDARPWARAIREEVLARRMPKWPIARGYGDFTNDPSLSPFEIALITAWVDGGAPETLPRPQVIQRPAVSAPATPTIQPPAGVRTETVPCGSTDVPAGTLVGLEPRLADGASVKMIVRHADGQEEPLLWLRGYDPAFAETYWLRRPLTLTSGASATISSTLDDGSCRMSLHFTR